MGKRWFENEILQHDDEEDKRFERCYWRRIAAWVVIAITVVWVTGAYAEQQAKPSIVEVVEISGEIGPHTAAQMSKMVETVNENQRVKALVLVMNSPGGGAVASAASYDELGKIKVPVVGWCDQMCASGGMYILMSPTVKHIGVRSETIAGSIGVIGQITRFNRLLEWAKIDNETYVSGSLKDAGNSSRAARDDERKYIQSIISDLAVRFYAVVGKTRKVTNWDAVKTGRIFIGEEAVKVGLADAVMDREEAIKKAKELSGAKLIFTREEMKKMSKAADDHAVYSAPPIAPQMGDVAALIEIIKEVREGESVSFSYKLPYRF